MLEETKDLWSYLGKADVICITTNGTTTKNGYGIMGRGCALEAKNRFPNIEGRLGRHLINSGNIPGIINDQPLIVSFPVKPAFGEYDPLLLVASQVPKWRRGDIVPGWAMKAMVPLIIKSAKKLVDLAEEHKWKKVVLPRPGCGNGELDWKDVCPQLSSILTSDKFIIVTKPSRLQR